MWWLYSFINKISIMIVILLSFPLQSQSDTKVIPNKKAMLLTGDFLLADPMLEVYHEWEINGNVVSRRREAEK